MRDLEIWVGRLDRHHLAVDPAESIDGFELAAARRHQLHANANAEERPPAHGHRLADRGFQPGHGGEPAPALGESTLARQHDAVGASDIVRVAGDDDTLAAAAALA